MKSLKLTESVEDLKFAIEAYSSLKQKKGKEKRMAFLSLSKAYEVAVEYTWKAFKRYAVNEGLAPQSPKAAVREAGKLGVIKNVEDWLEFIDARNNAVHDYFSIPEKDYVDIAKRYLQGIHEIMSTLDNKS